MNQERIIHYQYYNSHTLLLVTEAGKLKMLYTPFRVLCLHAIHPIPPNVWVYVEEVWSNERDELHYLILGQLYPYRHFKLPLLP